MIIKETGDLLFSHAEALVNAVNCEGIMGKGIAYQFKKKYPMNYLSYKGLCNNHRFNIGDVHITKEKNKHIVNFPTKDKWRKKSNYVFIEKGLIELRKKILDLNIKSIAIPPLGCGNGGLEWEQVERLIFRHLKDLDDVMIYLYVPANNLSSLSIKHLLATYARNKLKNKTRYNINATLYLAQIYCKGNLFVFDFKDDRLFSEQVNSILAELKEIKDRQGENFDVIIDDFINKNISKEIERVFSLYNYGMEKIIKIINSFSNKEETLIFASIFNLLKNDKETVTVDFLIKALNSYKESDVKVVLNTLLEHGIINFDMLENIKII